jgi:hypothetical protein
MKNPIAEAQLRAFLKKRDRAFETDDLEWARQNMPFEPSSPIVVEIAFHKARAACGAASKAKRKASEEWLKSHGYGPMGGTAADWRTLQ